MFLEVLTGAGSDDEEGAVAGDDGQAPLPDLRTILTSAIDDTSDDDGWSHLGAVGSVLSTRYPSFDSRNYGFGKLIWLVRDQDYLDVSQEGPPMVRLTPRPARPRGSGSRGR